MFYFCIYCFQLTYSLTIIFLYNVAKLNLKFIKCSTVFYYALIIKTAAKRGIISYLRRRTLICITDQSKRWTNWRRHYSWLRGRRLMGGWFQGPSFCILLSPANNSNEFALLGVLFHRWRIEWYGKRNDFCLCHHLLFSAAQMWCRLAALFSMCVMKIIYSILF